MTIQEYQKLASRTCPSLGEEIDTLHMKMGVVTEIGEAVDTFKKHIAYGKELDLVNIQEEISDTCWYIVNDMRFNEEKFLEDEMNGFDLEEEYKTPEHLSDILMNALRNWLSGEFDNAFMLKFLEGFSMCLGFDFYKGLENNINKLQVRYPEKFDEANALNRNLEAEREQLEK